MAKKLLTVLYDDLDGAEIPEGKAVIHTFTWKGVEYRIDLGPKNGAAFEKIMEKYVDSATRIGRAAYKKSAPDRSRADKLNKIREWARSNGYEVSDRGRVKGEIVEAYENANAA